MLQTELERNGFSIAKLYRLLLSFLRKNRQNKRWRRRCFKRGTSRLVSRNIAPKKISSYFLLFSTREVESGKKTKWREERIRQKRRRVLQESSNKQLGSCCFKLTRSATLPLPSPCFGGAGPLELSLIYPARKVFWHLKKFISLAPPPPSDLLLPTACLNIFPLANRSKDCFPDLFFWREIAKNSGHKSNAFVPLLTLFELRIPAIVPFPETFLCSPDNPCGVWWYFWEPNIPINIPPSKEWKLSNWRAHFWKKKRIWKKATKEKKRWR